MSERRIESRLLCSDMVSIEWKDRSGRMRSTVAVLEDISPAGACVQAEFQIPPRTRVQIVHQGNTIDALVRYCAYREIGFFWGLQFSPNFRWSRTVFQPKHLVDPNVITARARSGGASA